MIQCMGLPAEQSQPASRFAAYLKAEADTGIKHEYRDGHIVAMAGGSPAHSAVAATILGELHAQLKSSPCQPHGSDFRVRYGERTFYPDVLVVSPPPQLDPELPHTLLNPRVIVEVLSPGTETHDRGYKWFHYQQIPELTDFLLVSLEQQTVEHYLRQSDSSWLYQRLELADTVKLTSIGCELPVAACFARMDMWRDS